MTLQLKCPVFWGRSGATFCAPYFPTGLSHQANTLLLEAWRILGHATEWFSIFIGFFVWVWSRVITLLLMKITNILIKDLGTDLKPFLEFCGSAGRTGLELLTAHIPSTLDFLFVTNTAEIFTRLLQLYRHCGVPRRAPPRPTHGCHPRHSAPRSYPRSGYTERCLTRVLASVSTRQIDKPTDSQN